MPQRRGGGVFGRGGVVHSVPHTAGLNMKPHYCKLPQFTLSKGAKMDKTTTKKDFSWFDKAVDMHLSQTISLVCSYEMLHGSLISCFALSPVFFPAVGPSRRLSLSNCP